MTMILTILATPFIAYYLLVGVFAVVFLKTA